MADQLTMNDIFSQRFVAMHNGMDRFSATEIIINPGLFS